MTLRRGLKAGAVHALKCDVVRSAIASLLVLAGCASRPAALAPWHPIPGTSVTPRAEANNVCKPILEQGAFISSNRRGGDEIFEAAKLRFRACMQMHGWTDGEESANDPAPEM
jgi:hypothetical protein